METELSPELAQLIQEIDELVIARGWSTTDYYFDDSPFVGIHLIKNKNIWELYWREPGGSLIPQRFTNLHDAHQEMIKAITSMKQQESMKMFEVAALSEPAEFGESNQEVNSLEEIKQDYDDEEDFGNVIYACLLLLFMFLPWFVLVGIPLSIVIAYINSSR